MKTVRILRLMTFGLALGGGIVVLGKGHRDVLPGADLFVEGVIPHLQIEVSRENLQQLRRAPRKYVAATVHEGNAAYTNVLVRLKGGPGSFRPLDDKPAFTLNFSKVAPGQKFHGLKKLHLNNSVQDHTYLAEKISRELFEAAGVPAPRAGHASVELDDRNLGFYVLIEGVNKQFLGRYFKNTEGNVYDGHSQSEVTRRMPRNSGLNSSDPTGLPALAAAAQEPDLQIRLAKLRKSLDVDRFISFLATEVMICHWDGYAMNRNNFRIYHDLDSGRMIFIPQGTDQVFQRTTMPVFPNMVGLVAKSVLEVPELREQYRARMGQLLTNVYQIKPLTNHLYEVAGRVQAALSETDSQAAAGYTRVVDAFSRRIHARVRSLEHQLLSPTLQLEFDPSGLVSIPAWQPQLDLGKSTLTKEKGDKPGSILLHIAADGDSAASWRSRILLEPGQYRFHGRVRLQGVELDPQDPKAGAGLRISRQKFSRQLAGDSAWTTVAFDFQVRQDHTEVELVCELRAIKGEAWFDLNSLRLIRQQ